VAVLAIALTGRIVDRKPLETDLVSEPARA
jgi:hypothetical protein